MNGFWYKVVRRFWAWSIIINWLDGSFSSIFLMFKLEVLVFIYINILHTGWSSFHLCHSILYFSFLSIHKYSPLEDQPISYSNCLKKRKTEGRMAMKIPKWSEIHSFLCFLISLPYLTYSLNILEFMLPYLTYKKLFSLKWLSKFFIFKYLEILKRDRHGHLCLVDLIYAT